MPDLIEVELAVEARWVIPSGSGGVLENHVVLVDDARVVGILEAGAARSRYRAREWVERPGHALLPGLVNTHTHAAMTLMRGFADDLPLMQWLNDHIWPAEKQHVDEAFVRAGTTLAVAEMIRGGTTCFNEMYFHPRIAADVAVASGMRAVIGMIVFDMPTPWAATSGECIEKGLRVHDACRHAEHVTTAFAPHAPYTVEDDTFKRVRTLADELDVPVHMHVHETAHEIEMSLDRFGVRPLERLARLGLATPRLVAVHMTQLMDQEIRFCAAEGIGVVHCPESNLKLASGFCPVAALLDAGVNVALGTDGAASNNDLDMLGELRTAALLAKGVAGSPTAVPAPVALDMATAGGARALGLDADIGTLEAGKYADMFAVDLAAPRTSPVHDVLTQLVYSGSSAQVSDTWVAGRALLKDGRLTTIDEEAAIAEASRWRGILA